jgi:cell division protein FtsQ
MERKKPPRFPVIRLVAAILLGVFALFAVLIGFHRLEQFLIGDPRFALSGQEERALVEIAGATHAPRHQIEAVFSEDVGRSVYLVPLSDRRAKLREVDWVKDASVARIWPNRVVISIAERTPVAFLTLGKKHFALIDEDGIILPSAPDRFTLPVLTGLRATDSLTDRRERVHRMLRLTKELGEMTSRISEVDVSDRDNLKVSEPYEGRSVTLLLGDHNFAARYQNFVTHYADIKKRLPGATTLDLRLEDRITVVE